MSTRLRVWYFRVGAALCMAAPWVPKLIDRLGHLLDLGCTGIH